MANVMTASLGGAALVVKPSLSAPAAFDEMRGGDGAVRPAYAELASWLDGISPEGLLQRRREAELLFRRIGITFAVHGEAEAQERLIPFDVVPRILSGAEWGMLARGLEQRVRALNLFLKDVYSQREILRAGIVPEDLIFRNPLFRPEMNGQKVPHDLYVLIAGIDIVRVDAETFYVLEDNARTPSGVDPDDIDPGDEHVEIVRHFLAVHLRAKQRIAEDQILRDDSGAQDLPLRIDVLEEQVERAHALLQPAGKHAPFRAG